MEEGDAMIRALIADLLQVRDVDILCMRHPAARRPLPVEVRSYGGEADFVQCTLDADASWLIAPETEGCLRRLAELVAKQKRPLFNCTPEAIDITTSKQRTAQVLAAADVPVIACYASMQALPANVSAVVVKPDDGAGCVDTYVVHRGESIPSLRVGMIYQPYVAGDARSFSMLCTRGGVQLLCINRQHVDRRENFLAFHGVEADVVDDTDGEIMALAERIHAAIPGLRGYVGVDFVQTVDGPVVVEINPRLTSAYVGMSDKLGFNVAARVLDSYLAGLL